MSDIATHLKSPGVMHVSLQGLLPPFKHGRRHAQLHAADSSCSPAIFPVACNILKVGPQTLSAGLSGHCMLKKDHPRHVSFVTSGPRLCGSTMAVLGPAGTTRAMVVCWPYFVL